MAFLHRYHRELSSFLFFLLVSLLPTSVTIFLDCCFHWQFVPNSSYFHHISSEVPTFPHRGAQCQGIEWLFSAAYAAWSGAANKEFSLNKNTDADSIAFASAFLGGGKIIDEEGASQKENLLAAITALEEAITTGVVAVNIPKKKTASITYEAFSFFSYDPLS